MAGIKIFLERYSIVSKLLKTELLFKTVILFAIIGIIGFKTWPLYQDSNLIAPEVIGPNVLSLSGKMAEDRFLHGKLKPLDQCESQGSCKDELEKRNSVVIKESQALLDDQKHSVEKEEVKKYLIENHFLYASEAAFRGFIIHHYSTILFPYREYQNGNYSYLLTAQNGLASLLPLFFMQDLKFNLFPVIGMVFLGLFALFVLLIHHKNTHFYSFVAPLYLCAMTLNVGSQRLHPGFSYFRYFPSLALIYVTHQFLKGRFQWVLACFLILGLLNSVQFNILVCLIIIGLMISPIIFRAPKVPHLYYLPLLLGVIILLQIYCFEQQKNPASTSLFGSLGEGGSFSFSFCFQVLILPISAFAVKLWKERSELRFFASEMLGYISFVCFSIYTITKPGSPGHCSGFIFMCVYSVYLILKDTGYPRLVQWSVLGLFLMIFPFQRFKLTKPTPVSTFNSTLFNSKSFGAPLRFASYHDLNLIQKEYENLISPHRSEGKIYFLSKDKIYLETLSGRNIDPKGYDPFLASLNFDWREFTKQMRAIDIKYLVIDSPIQRKITQAFIQFKALKKEEVGEEEARLYLALLSAHDHFAAEHAAQLVACSKRYCLYKL